MIRAFLLACLGVLLPFQIATLAAEPSAYEKAFHEAQTRKQPLIVLVGATWCPGCQTMKQSVIPQMTRRGDLKNVSYATVDFDAEPAQAGNLMRGNGLPQLIVFHQHAGKWQREQIVGPASETEIQRLVARARAGQDKQTENSTGGGGND